MRTDTPSAFPLAGTLDSPEIRQARIDLAACFRMAARLGMGEGICNHFSFVLPGHRDLFLVNPYGLAFADVTASSLLICDFHGRVVAGEGQPEATAFFIHAQLHRLNPGRLRPSTPTCLTRRRCACWRGSPLPGPDKHR